MTQHKPLIVSVDDQIVVKDNLNTWKKWFNGMKHFMTVKVLPPRNK